MLESARSPRERAPRAALAFSLLTLLGGSACQHREAAPPPPAPPANGEPPGIGMTGVTKPLMQLLTDEKTHRPSGTPTAEAVFAAVKQGGILTLDQAQVLGRMVGADFCENAHTDHGIVLSVCEFQDADALAKGRAYSEKTFSKSLPNRTLLTNRKTLLTINPPDASPAVKDQVGAVTRIFATL
jgi:hypothetical protein